MKIVTTNVQLIHERVTLETDAAHFLPVYNAGNMRDNGPG